MLDSNQEAMEDNASMVTKTNDDEYMQSAKFFALTNFLTLLMFTFSSAIISFATICDIRNA